MKKYQQYFSLPSLQGTLKQQKLGLKLEGFSLFSLWSHLVKAITWEAILWFNVRLEGDLRDENALAWVRERTGWSCDKYKVKHWLSFQQTINICENPKQAFE